MRPPPRVSMIKRREAVLSIPSMKSRMRAPTRSAPSWVKTKSCGLVSDLISEGIGKYLPHIRVAVLSLKHDVSLFHLLLAHSPLRLDHRGGCVRYDECVECHGRIREAGLDLFDRLVEAKFVVVGAEVAD